MSDVVLKALIDFLLNPVTAPLLVAIAGVAALVWYVERRRVSPPNEAPTPKREFAQLSTEQAALIERALAACSDLFGDGPGADDARAMLRVALGDFLRKGEAAGRRVATLLADRRTHEAQDLAASIAGQARDQPHAQAWLDASAVASLNDVRAAIAAAEKARELGAGDAVAQAWLGRLYLRRGRLGEAEAALQAALFLYDRDENAKRAGLHLDLGEAALQRGDRPAARALFDTAIALYGEGDEAARYARARVAKLDGPSAMGDEN